MRMLLRELVMSSVHGSQASSKQPELMTVKETATYLRIPVPTVYYLINQGVIPAIQIGGRYRIKRSQIDREILKVADGATPCVVVVEEGIEVEFCEFAGDNLLRIPLIVGVGDPAQLANTYDRSMRDFHPALRIVVVVDRFQSRGSLPSMVTILQAPFTREHIECALISTMKGGEK